ncbi:hypothetical protein BC831DRAFT_434564 [Entophlyctis helioformis]|nr:hypothetical protein BC831DRAFT_434564 [Entophlyctis helioformis]
MGSKDVLDTDIQAHWRKVRTVIRVDAVETRCQMASQDVLHSIDLGVGLGEAEQQNGLDSRIRTLVEEVLIHRLTEHKGAELVEKVCRVAGSKRKRKHRLCMTVPYADNSTTLAPVGLVAGIGALPAVSTGALLDASVWLPLPADMNQMFDLKLETTADARLMAATQDGYAFCSEIRAAARLLATDHVSQQRTLPLAAFGCVSLLHATWMLDTTTQNEPGSTVLARTNAASPWSQGLEMNSNGLHRTVTSLATRSRLVTSLIDLVSGSEESAERDLAARMLGSAVQIMLAPDFPRRLRKLAFDSVVIQFLVLFPANHSSLSTPEVPYFGIRTVVSPQTFQSRIAFINALSRFLQTPEASSPAFMAYFDELFAAILSSGAHHLLVAAAVQALSTQLPVTNRNRLRVERPKREPMAPGMTSDADPFAKSFNSSSLNASARRRSSSHDLVTRSRNSNTTIPGHGDLGLHPLLVRSLHMFWSTWYSRPSDAAILCINPNPLDALPRLESGFVNRRKAILNVPVGKGSRVTLNDVSDQERMAAIASLNMRPYIAQDAPPMVVDFFGSTPPSLPVCLDPGEELDIHFPPGGIDPPRASVLSLNLKPPIIEFNSGPFTFDSFLENMSLQQDMPFCIQVFPPQFFRVTPAFGIVGRGESIPIHIQFYPKPCMYRKTPEIRGFLRIRGMDGFPVERVSLVAYNTPSVKVTPARLDFGFCPKGETRIAAFSLTNVLSVECPVVMIINPAVATGAFHLSHTQVMLAPRERRTITIKFHSGDAEGLLEDELILVSFGSDLNRLPLSAMCSNSLRVLERKIDFGPTDIYFSSVEKKVHLFNLDPTRSLPVSFQPSSREIVVNNHEPVILKPSEECAVPVEFTSALSGIRQEHVMVYAPNAPPVQIDMAAFSGPLAIMPIFEDIYFPPTSLGVGVTARIPVTNIGTSNAHIIVTVATGYPIRIHAMESDYSNRRLNVPNVVVESKPYEANGQEGLYITLSNRMTITIEIEFKCTTPGFFKIPLVTQLVKPKKLDVATHNMFFIVVNDEVLSAPKALQTFRQFSRMPFVQTVTPITAFKQPAPQPTVGPTPKTPRSNASEVFQLFPNPQMIFGSTSPSRPYETMEFVTLSNTTNEVQRYHLVISHHFVTDVPLEGDLPANASMDIPIRIDPSLYVTPETKHFMAMGAISVLDANFNQPGMISAQLTGVMDDLIWLESREGTKVIKFPSTRVMEIQARKLVIRNKSPLDLVWEASLVHATPADIADLSKDGKAAVGASSTAQPQSTDGWLPFALSVTKVNLKPFEYCVIDVSFTSNVTGDFKCKLGMSYVDPVEHLEDHNQTEKRVRQKRQLGPWLLECSVGSPDVGHLPEYFNFGDVSIADKVERPLALVNNQPLTADIAFAPLQASLPSRQKLSVTPKTKLEMGITFAPPRNTYFAELLAFSSSGVTHSIPILGYGGVFGIDSNLARPFQLTSSKLGVSKDAVPPAAESTIDFGLVNMQVPKTKVFLITNTGTLDLTLLGLVSGDERHLTWEPLEEPDDALAPRDTEPVFGREKADVLEVDWDEADWRAEQETYLRNAGGGGDIARYGSLTTAMASMQQQSGQSGATGVKGQRRGKNGNAVSKSSHAYLFPLRIPPFQSLRLSLKFSGTDKGDFSCPLRLEVDKNREEATSFVWWIKGSLQPPLHLWEKKIDFGIRAVHIQHYDIFATYKLFTEDFAESAIQIHGTGASSRLMIDSTVLNFGTLRVGTPKVLKLALHNKGILPLKFFIESSHTQFHADPEQGALEADGRTELVVKFLPKAVGSLRANIKITSISDEGHQKMPITVLLSGTGSYPELVVLTRVVEFGTALFKNPNRRVIRVQNKGAAEAHVVFSCFHPDIALETGGRGGLIIEPRETKDLVIVYTPQIVERLDAKAFMRSSDARGDNFMITLKGTVGIPRLTITPFDALDSLDFGVMRLNKVYKKTFKISNDGNIFLNFKVQLETVSQNQVPVEVDIDNPVRRPVQNAPPPLTVEPHAGTLGVGEEATMVITFAPTMLVEYEYKITLVYDFQSFVGVIKGVGGRAMLKLDSPLKAVDFGVSRLNRTYVKIVSLSNRGNLGFRYHVRPEPEDGNWDVYDSELAQLAILESKSRPETGHGLDLQPLAGGTISGLMGEEPFWLEYLAKHGIRVLNADGYCPAHAKLNLIVEFEPKAAGSVLKPMRVYFGDHFEAFDISGCGASPKLHIRDAKGGQIISVDSSPQINIGVHPVNSVYTHLLELVNDGAFGIDYLVQPMSNAEFDVFPLRGFIEAGTSATLKVFFQPNSENLFHTTFKMLWEGKSLTAQIVGNGGLGRLEVSYLDDKDVLLKGLDFGMVPFNSACEKRFHLLNLGMVGFGEPFAVDEVKKPRPSPKGLIFSWYNVVKTVLPPNRAVEFGARFLARSATTSVGNITIRSECGSLMIPVKGKGGTIALSHRGDLDFGDISCNYTYTRKITIVNGGSIPSQLAVEWLVVGHSTEHASSTVKLTENYTPLDPRSGWARLHYLREKGIADMKKQLVAKEYWALVMLMVKKSAVKESDMGRASYIGGRFSDASIGMGMSAAIGASSSTAAGAMGINGPGTASGFGANGSVSGAGHGGHSRLAMVVPSFAGVASKRAAPAFSMHFKRRQMFYHLITSTQLTSQSTTRVRPYVKVDPPISLLPSYGETTFSIELHLATEDTFLATLIVRSDVPNTPVHEISLTATPKIVNIICDDTRMLNFYRQPLGETEYITRSFTNVGHKDIAFRFINNNVGLTIVPSKGNLKVGQTVSVTFAFKPLDESIQNSDVTFEPNCSQHIRFRMYGGGGYAKASLARYRRFDFGHCMIGKDTISFLPITNEGNAILHLTRFEIVETDTFFRGKDWPDARISLFPGKTYNLPLVFNPHEENPAPGRLIVGTNAETYEIELIGLGREAVLIVSKVALEFSECLIGNSYEQKLGLKNIGDVNYPVTFQLEKEFPDLEFYPSSLVIDPFSESFVAITYTPSHETKTTVVFSVSSPYSTHKVPVMVHAGVATLEFNSLELDFGMFERTTRPAITLAIKNTGTVRTSYHVKDTIKPSMFQITPARGMLTPGKTVDIKITHTKHEVAQFEERLIVKTDLIDKLYHVKVRGQCEETVLHPDEFSLISMGICPVLETTTKPLVFRNHGRFPLDFSIKAAYPLKVFPTQGQVMGEESGMVSIQWNPSGGYELRTQIQMVTNIGKFQIIVRGKAMFPEIHVNNMYLDFGVCAVAYTYRESFQIENKGKVPVHFTIPPCKESSYATSIGNGVLAPKETIPVDVYFTPASIGKLTSSVMVECKGIHYKEIVVVGVGGQMKVEVHPKSINVGRCPFGLRIYETISIANGGDVALYVDFSPTELEQGDCQIMVPDTVTIGPKRSAKCIIGFAASVVGHFSAKLQFNTKEQSFCIPISGVGVKIVLTGRSKQILESEQLWSVKDIHPFHVEPDMQPLDFCIYRMHRKFMLDTRITQLISQLFFMHRRLDEEGSMSDSMSGTGAQGQRRVSRGIPPLLLAQPSTASQEVTATAAILPGEPPLGQHAGQEQIVEQEPLPSTDASAGSHAAVPAPAPAILDSPRAPDALPSVATDVSTLPGLDDTKQAAADPVPQMANGTADLPPLPVADAVLPAAVESVAESVVSVILGDGIVPVVTAQEEAVDQLLAIARPQSGMADRAEAPGALDASMAVSPQQHDAKEVDLSSSASRQPLASSARMQVETKSPAIQKREQLMSTLEHLSSLAHVEVAEIDAVFDEPRVLIWLPMQFISVKDQEYSPVEPSHDLIVHNVIDYGRLKV